MAGIASLSPTALYFTRHMAVESSELARKSISGNGIHRRNLRIAAEVRFVNVKEAKQLLAAEGYAVVDVRDKTRFERAHIKSCHHIPLFIQNEDNNFGSSKGYGMVRATRGVLDGAWYFEIKVLNLGETGHTRLGWSTDKRDLQALIGYGGHSFGFKDIDGCKIHKALREKYAKEGYKEGL